jgi:hypothetical protein
MAANKMTLEVTIDEKKYTVRGNYYPPWDGTYEQPPEASEFDILSVKDENGEEFDLEEDERKYQIVCDAADAKWFEEQSEYWKTYASDSYEDW